MTNIFVAQHPLERLSSIAYLPATIKQLSKYCSDYVLSAKHVDYLLQHLFILIKKLKNQPHFLLDNHAELLSTAFHSIRQLAENNRLKGEVQAGPIHNLLNLLSDLSKEAALGPITEISCTLEALIKKSHLAKEKIDKAIVARLQKKLNPSKEIGREDIRGALERLRGLIEQDKVKIIFPESPTFFNRPASPSSKLPSDNNCPQDSFPASNAQTTIDVDDTFNFFEEGVNPVYLGSEALLFDQEAQAPQNLDEERPWESDITSNTVTQDPCQDIELENYLNENIDLLENYNFGF